MQPNNIAHDYIAPTVNITLSIYNIILNKPQLANIYNCGVFILLITETVFEVYFIGPCIHTVQYTLFYYKTAWDYISLHQ